jgi:hypothetical protein
MFLWSTDASLRLKSVSDAAIRLMGMDPDKSEGREILDVFGMEGQNLAILEAHTAALTGQTSTFTLEGPGSGRLRCRVAAAHDGDDWVIGTFTIARREPREPVSPAAADLVGARVA